MNKTYHHGDLRRALIDAGLDILDREGLAAVGVRACAREAGVSHAAPLRHFPDLTSLVAAIATECYRHLGDAMASACDRADNAGDGFLATGLAYVDFAVEYPNRFRVLSHPSIADKSNFSELSAESDRAFEALRGALSAAQAAGVVRDGEPRSMALTAWVVVHGLASLVIDDQLRAKGYDSAIHPTAEKVLEVLYVGLAPTPHNL